MTLQLVSVDPKASPRQRRFDQQVRDLLNGLLRNGGIGGEPGDPTISPYPAQAANTVLAGPATGAAAAPAFRALADADIPAAIARDSEVAAAVAALKFPVVLFDHFADQGNVTTGETDLYSDTLAAGRLAAAGEKVTATYGGVFVSSATATRQVKLYFGGTAVFDTGALTLSLSSAWVICATLVRVSASVVRYCVSMTTEGAALAAYTAVGELTGLTLANAQVLKVTGQASGVGAATNDVVAKLGTVSFVPAA